MRIIAAVCGIVCLSAGCSTMGAVREARSDASKGTTVIYKGECSRQFGRATNAALRLGWQIEAKDEAGGEILATANGGASGYGEFVGVWLTATNKGRSCAVRVYSQKRVATDITAKDWEPEFFEAFDRFSKDAPH